MPLKNGVISAKDFKKLLQTLRENPKHNVSDEKLIAAADPARREKISNSLRDYYQKQEHRNKLSQEIKASYTEARKEKLRQAGKNRIWREETKQKLSDSHKGVKLTDEHKKNIGLAKKGMKQTPESVKKRQLSNKGKKRSAETIIKMKAAWTKRSPITEETRKKISEAQKGKPKLNLRKPQQRLTCPHCHLEGGMSAMKHWHFDKCKKMM